MIKLQYEPFKLIEVSHNIRMIHKNTAKTHNMTETERKAFITEISSLPSNVVYKYAELLSDSKLEYIARYIPYNFYNVSLDNLMLIFKYKITETLFTVLYNSWQSAYKKKNCIYLMKDCCGLKQCKDIIAKFHLDNGVLLQWLSSEYIEESVCKTLTEYHYRNNVSYKFAEQQHGLISSDLSSEAAKLFLMYCKKEDYLSFNCAEIIEKTAAYNKRQTKIFMFNFLNEVNVQHFKKYQSLWVQVLSTIGNIDSDKFHSFFSDKQFLLEFYPNAENNYIYWYNYSQVDIIFKDDSRGVFWKKMIFEYDFVRYKYNKSSDSIVMRFGNVVVVEFSIMGALHIYSSTYYDEHIKKICENNSYNITDLKSCMNNHSNKEFFENRIEHRGEVWKTNVKSQLKYAIGKFS